MTSFQSGEFTLQATCDWPDDTCSGPVPAIIYCHGFTGHRLETRRAYARLAATLAGHGIAGFRFDHRGCGESDGDFIDFTPKGMLQDLDAALTAFLAQPKIDLSRTAIVGYSLGSCSASYLLNKRPQFAAAVLWAAVARPEIIRDRLSQFENFEGYQQRGYMDYGGFRVSAEYLDTVGEILKPLDWIATYQNPILFIQGADDDIVKPEQTERYLRARENPDDVAVFIPNADHSFTSAENFDGVLRRTEEWLIQRL
ncbi:MAG: alpha/beta hydrolase family protein [Candidatus Sumerlaeaceae bacterium]